MKKVLLALAVVLGAASAQATTSAKASQAWNCSFGFNGVSTGVKIFIGFYNFNGKGSLQCVSDAGETVTYPVKVTMRAAPLSPSISLGVMHLYARALDFRIENQSPLDVLGTYSLAQGQAAVIGGLGVVTALHETSPNFALKLSLQLAHGLGVNLGLNRMHVELDRGQME
jgi:hypothetical protein